MANSSVDIALVPLLLGLAGAYAVPASASGVSAGRAIASLALGALVSLAFARDPFAAERRTRLGLGLVGVLAIWYVITRAWSLDPGGSMLEGGRLASFGLFVYAGHVALTRASSRWVALAAAGAAAVIVGAPDTWDILRDGAPKVRVPGHLGYWNASAIVALVLVPLAAALGRASSRWLVLLAGPLVAIGAATAAATASRGALAATVVGLVVLVVSSPDRRAWIGAAATVAAGTGLGIVLLARDPIPAWLSLCVVAVVTSAALAVLARRVGTIDRDTTTLRTRRMSVLGVVLCVAIAGMVGGLALRATHPDLAAAPGVDNSVNRLTTTDDSLRVEWWHEALDLWQHGRLAGQGGNAFEVARAGRVADFADHPHSLALQVLVETGIVGVLLAAVASLLLLRAALGARRTPERAVALAVLTMVLAQAAIDWTWSIPQVMGVLAVAIAVALPGRSRSDVPVQEEVPRTTMRSALATLGVVVVVAGVALVPFGAGMLADQAAADLDAGRTAVAADRARLSMRLEPAYDTLQLEVLALEAAGHPDQAKRSLLRARQVWSARPDGLTFARRRFTDDPNELADIDRRTADMQADAAARATPG